MWNKKTASSRNTSEPTNSDNDKLPSMAAFNALEMALWSVYNPSFYFIFEKENVQTTYTQTTHALLHTKQRHTVNIRLQNIEEMTN